MRSPQQLTHPKCRAPVPPSSARPYMASLTDDRHPRSNQRAVAVIQSPLQPGLMTLISPNLVWCVFPQRTPSLLVRTPVSLRLTQPLSRLRSSSIDHPKSHVSSRITHHIPCDCLANTEENIEKKTRIMSCYPCHICYVHHTQKTPKKFQLFLLYGTSESMFHHKNRWLESLVRIQLPLNKMKMLETQAAEFKIGGIFHRDIINIISSIY